MNRQIVGIAKAMLTPRSALRVVARNSSHYKPPAHWVEPHMNELPVPQGSWQTANATAQKKNNLHLIVGTSFFVFTLIFMKTSGLITLNATIPKLPDEN